MHRHKFIFILFLKFTIVNNFAKRKEVDTKRDLSPIIKPPYFSQIFSKHSPTVVFNNIQFTVKNLHKWGIIFDKFCIIK